VRRVVLSCCRDNHNNYILELGRREYPALLAMTSQQPNESLPLGTLRASLGALYTRVRARFEVDTRSLAAFRVALGLIILVDLVHRAPHIELFYTDAGVFPRDILASTYPTYSDLTLHGLSGSLWFQQVMFLLAGLFAVAMVLGYRTRLVTFVSLLLLFSLHGRNPLVLNGGDRLFRVLLIVALAAPIGERWSIDAVRRGSARQTVASFGTAAVLAQPLAVFVSNAILKHQGDTWYTGEALEIAMHNDVMTIFLGDVVVEYPALMTVLNYGWVTLLAGSVLFLLVPVGRVRAVTTLAYVGAFAGMLLTMTVGLFPLLLTASVLPYLPTQFWDTLRARVPSRWTQWLPEAQQLGPLGRPPVERRLLAGLRSRGYGSVSSVVTTSGTTFMTVVGVAMLAWILVFSAYDVSTYDPPDEIDNRLLTQQDWGLYTPNPNDGYSWFVSEARLADGTAVDAFGGGELTFDRPPDAAEEYETFRHRKYLQKVRGSGRDAIDGPIANRYAEWGCLQAQQHYEQQVVVVRVYQMYQPSPIDGELESPSKIDLVDSRCDVDTDD
jgi:hypothetical protein